MMKIDNLPSMAGGDEGEGERGSSQGEGNLLGIGVALSGY